MGIVQRDSLYLTLISYTGVAIGYFNKVILFTNFLSTEQVGLANLLVTISVLYAQVASMGAYNIVLKFFPFFQNKTEKHHGFLFGIMALATGGFIMATLLFLLLQKPIRLFYTDSSPLLAEYFLYVIPLALASVYYQLFEAYLRSLQKNIVPSVTNELIQRTGITVSILLFALNVITFPVFVVIYVAVHCLPVIIITIYTAIIRQLFIQTIYSTVIRRMAKLILVYGLFSLFNNLSALILSSIDSLMLANMIDLGTTGIYTTMIFITSVILIPYRSILRVAGPLVAGYWKDKNIGKMQELYRKTTASGMVIGSLIFLLIWANLDALFMLMPGEYHPGKMVFLLLGLGKLFDMAAGLNGTILLTSKKYRYDLLFTTGLIAFAVASNMLFIPLFGMNGAALASMLTIIAFNLLRIIFIKYHFNMQPFEPKDLIVPALVGFIAILSVWIQFTAYVVADVVIRSVLVTVVFIVPVYLMKVSSDINLKIDRYWQLLLYRKK